MTLKNTVFTHAALTILASGVVVDKSKSDKLSAADHTHLFNQTYALGKPVLYVDNAVTFFTASNLFRSLEADDDTWHLIVEKFGIDLSHDELATIRNAIAIRKRIRVAVDGMKPAYDFSPIPKGWSVEGDLYLGIKEVRRTRANPNGNSTSYGLNPKTLQRIWVGASKVWAKMPAAPTSLATVRHDYSNKRVQVQPTFVTIGCQNVQRYELEQLALTLGWPFPEA